MNIEEITRYIITNYNDISEKFINLLKNIDCKLIYNGKGLKDCIHNRLTYSCSISFVRKKRHKVLNNILPIMIGSKLDVAIRKLDKSEFSNLDNVPNLAEGKFTFEEGDIGMCCFLINGALKQIPFFITNDVTNPHIAQGSMVRLYRYDANEKGQELTMFFRNTDNFQRGDLIVKLNDGSYSDNVQSFFESIYPIDSKIYFEKIFKEPFNIDNLENRVIISPGHLFYKLFTKNLYIPLKTRNFKEIAQKHAVIVNSITNGDILHIISKKTIFHKEIIENNKKVNVQGSNQQREIGHNDEIYIEKKSTPYRDANCQIYPYFPYMAHFTNLQISNKVKSKKVLAYSNSYIGFLCLYGTSEAKNVGRVMMLTRDTFVSTQDDTSQLYDLLNIQVGKEDYYVVINSACISITKSCFNQIDLRYLKKKLLFVECYRHNNFILINYKMGLLYKKFEVDCWVTARDFHYWRQKIYNFKTFADFLIFKGNSFITSYNIDLLKYVAHNSFPKNLLTVNAFKNSVLATTPKYSLYFKETVSAYMQKTDLHQPVLKPQNEFSKNFVMYLPKLNIMFTSFKGNTQEDCIVMQDGLDVFNIYRFYTVKIKFKTDNLKHFHPRIGPPNPFNKKSFLGTIASESKAIEILSQTMHLTLVNKGNFIQIYFNKPHFTIVKHVMSNISLMIAIETLHPCSTGDKLCSLNGQKGVLQKHANLPYVMIGDQKIKPHLLINSYCIISRQTMGQIIEMMVNGKDYVKVFNSDNIQIPGMVALLGYAFYMVLLYLSIEHYYNATKCNRDKISGIPIRGRSRQGGMRTGNMELINGYRGNGIAACFEVTMLENSNRIIFNKIPISQSIILCNEDAHFFKVTIEYTIKESVVIYIDTKKLKNILKQFDFYKFANDSIKRKITFTSEQPESKLSIDNQTENTNITVKSKKRKITFTSEQPESKTRKISIDNQTESKNITVNSKNRKITFTSKQPKSKKRKLSRNIKRRRSI